MHECTAEEADIEGQEGVVGGGGSGRRQWLTLHRLRAL